MPRQINKSSADNFTGVVYSKKRPVRSAQDLEKVKAQELLDFLKERRAVYYPKEIKRSDFFIKSVLRIRKHLRSLYETVDEDSRLGESVEALRLACKKFCFYVESSEKHSHCSSSFLYHLGELRAHFGMHIARIACIYDLELAEEFSSILLSKEPD